MEQGIPRAEWQAFYEPYLSDFKVSASSAQASARCPFPGHDDHKASFSVNIETGQYQCFGCDEKGNGITFAKAMDVPLEDVPGYADAGLAILNKRVAAIYQYLDEQGLCLYEVLRYDPKAFLQRKPNGKGGWEYSVRSVRRVPYQLPNVITSVKNHQPVLIVEGEKDVETAMALGFCATTNAGGAGRWQPEFAEYLVGADVIIIPDKDVPGARHGDQVAQCLLHKAASVKMLALPGEAKDLSGRNHKFVPGFHAANASAFRWGF